MQANQFSNHQVDLSKCFHFNTDKNSFESVFPKQTLLLTASYNTQKFVV